MNLSYSSYRLKYRLSERCDRVSADCAGALDPARMREVAIRARPRELKRLAREGEQDGYRSKPRGRRARIDFSGAPMSPLPAPEGKVFVCRWSCASDAVASTSRFSSCYWQLSRPTKGPRECITNGDATLSYIFKSIAFNYHALASRLFASGQRFLRRSADRRRGSRRFLNAKLHF